MLSFFRKTFLCCMEIVVYRENSEDFLHDEETSDCPYWNFVLFFINPVISTGKPQDGISVRVTGFGVLKLY